MKNLKFSRLFAAALVVACLALTGCKPQTEEVLVEKVYVVKELSASHPIIGNWEDNYEEWNTYDDYDCQIKADMIKPASYYSSNNGTVYIREVSENSGYIYYQFSAPISLWNGSGYDDVDVTGKWGAIAYQELTANSVQMCDADYTDQDFVSTLEECVTKYTKANKYFAYINTPFTRVTE